MVRTAAVFFVIVVMLATAIALVQGDVGSGACVSFFSAATTACGNTVDSDFGNGAVELCGDCFACGYPEGICPEDFGANCSECADEDCTVTVWGHVYSPTGSPLSGAEVIAYQDHFTKVYVNVTDDSGFYNFTIPRGNYNLRIRHNDYPYQEIPLPPELGPLNIDVTMTIASCTPACESWTQAGMRCQSVCNGTNGCNPPQPPYTGGGGIMTNLLDTCSQQGASAATVVYLGAVDQETQLWGTCCSGPVYTTRWKKAIEPRTNASDVMQKTIPVTYKTTNTTIPGVKFKIITYK